MNFRVIFSNNGTLSDLTSNLLNYQSGTEVVDFVAAEDKIYIGALYPFNSFYLVNSVANASASVMTVKAWDGIDFNASAESIDGTAVAGASFAQSGHVDFTPDRNKSWIREDTVDSTGAEQITGLGDIKIYDRYWLEVSFSADLDAVTALSFIGYLFSNDNNLGAEFPDLDDDDERTNFEAGKTSWEEQGVVASSLLIDDLEGMDLLSSGEQLLDRRKLRNLSVSKVAEIIYNVKGNSFEDERRAAKAEYKNRLKKDLWGVDRNNNARLDPVEIVRTNRRLQRRN